MIARLKSINRLELAGIILLGLGIYIFHFYPYLSSMGDSIFYFNDSDDAKVYSWNAWHFAHQVKEAHSPFHTDYMFHPEGSSLWMHAYTIWFGLLNLVLDNPALSINLGIAVQLIVAFVGFYYLAKALVVRRLLSVLVACYAVFNSYILAKCGVHYNLVLIGVLPFLIGSILRLFPIEDGRLCFRKSSLFGFLSLLLVAFFMDYYMVFYGLAFLVLYVLWFGGLNTFFDTWNWKKSIGVLSLFGVGHIVLRLMRISGFEEKGAVWAAADIRLLWRPTIDNFRMRGQSILEIPNTLNDNKIFIGVFVGVAILLSFLFFLRDHKSDSIGRFLFFLSIVFFMVTLPVVRIAGMDVFYFFTGIVHYIPFLDNVRSPDRFVLLLMISSGMLMCRVLYLQMEKGVWTGSKYVVPFLLLFVLLENKQKKMLPLDSVIMIPEMEMLHDRTVLMLPFGIRDGFQEYGDFDESQLLYQQQYGFKSPSGYLSRVSDDIWTYYRSNKLYNKIVELQDGKIDADFDWSAALRDEGITALYVSRAYSTNNIAVTHMLKLLELDSKKTEEGVLYSLSK